MPLSLTRVTDGINDILASHQNEKADAIEANATGIPLADADYVNTQTLSATLTLTNASDPLQFLDPGGAGRQVNLPAEAATNHPFYIVNTADAAETLTVKAFGGGTIDTVNQGEAKLFVSNGVAWRALSGGGAAGMANSNISPTTADVTAAVNTRYFADISGLTANRNFKLPAGAVGDEIELNVKVGNATYELIIIGDTGVKINGGSIATEETRVQRTGASIRLVAQATDNWQIMEVITRRARITSEASSATPTINTDLKGAQRRIHRITALAAAITSMTTNLTGSPVHGDMFAVEILDNGTARAITWGASFRSNNTLPTTTTISKLLRVLFMYDSVDAIWDCVAKAEEA